MRKQLGVAVAAVLVGLVTGCAGNGGSDNGGGEPAGPAGPNGAPATTLTVSAAASLTDVFTELGETFEQQNPGTSVRFNYGGSSSLAQQIVQGAPVDVFAAADTTTMDTVAKANLTTAPPVVFATNKLQIAVAPGNPKGVRSFADLTRPDLKVVDCADPVPCGKAVAQVEQATGATLKPVSEEPDVRSVLGKVTSGDADAGLVYVTDVRSTDGKVDGIDFPEAGEAVNSYPVTTLNSASQPALAARFIEFVRGPEAKNVLHEAGFGTP